MKLPTIPPGLAGKIVKNRPLSEPIRLQDLEDSASYFQAKIGRKIRIFSLARKKTTFLYEKRVYNQNGTFLSKRWSLLDVVFDANVSPA